MPKEANFFTTIPQINKYNLSCI